VSVLLAFSTPLEMKATLSFTNRPPVAHETECVPWQYQGREFLVLVTGIGLVNAAFSLGRALGAEPGVSGVINFGVMGAFDLDRLPLRSAAVVGKEIWPEFGLITYRGLVPEALGFPQWKGPDGPVFDKIDLAPDRAAASMKVSLPGDWPRIVSLSVAGVTGNLERAKELFETYGPDCENMEGFALALGCLHAELPFLEVRTISNLVGAREHSSWDLEGSLKALGGAAEKVLSGEQNE